MKFSYIQPFVEHEIEKNQIAGANICVIKDDKMIFNQSFGYADKENKKTMQRDTIFRLFSMTKPITAVAIMILYERGQIFLFDPVSKYLPGFKNQVVFKHKDSYETEPVKNDITILQLLNMTSGLTYPGTDNTSSIEMGKLFDEVKNKLEKGEPTNTYDFANRIGRIPLLFQPGESWNYGTSADILGAIIEVVTQKSLEQFLQEEIFEPLQMCDTSFYVTDEKRSRLSQIYEYKKEEGTLVPYTDNYLGLNNYTKETAFLSGGAGLTSTIDDYAKFALMLLHKGMYQEKHILGRKTIDYMTKNQLNAKQLEAFCWPSLRGHGYGNLLRIMTDPSHAGSNGSIGEYGWDGWTGNYITIDPKENLIILYFIQKTNTGTDDTTLKLRNIIFGGLE